MWFDIQNRCSIDRVESSDSDIEPVDPDQFAGRDADAVGADPSPVGRRCRSAASRCGCEDGVHRGGCPPRPRGGRRRRPRRVRSPSSPATASDPKRAASREITLVTLSQPPSIGSVRSQLTIPTGYHPEASRRASGAQRLAAPAWATIVEISRARSTSAVVTPPVAWVRQRHPHPVRVADVQVRVVVGILGRRR